MTDDSKGLYSIFEENGTPIEYDFESEKAAVKFAEANGWERAPDFDTLIHSNQTAVEILRSEYSDYRKNDWHYDRQYKMLVKMQEITLAKIKSDLTGLTQ